MRTNLAERLGYEPEEETRERQERLLEELRYQEAMRRVAKTCCVWLGGAAFVLAVIAGYAEMTDACVATGAIALGLRPTGSCEAGEERAKDPGRAPAGSAGRHHRRRPGLCR